MWNIDVQNVSENLFGPVSSVGEQNFLQGKCCQMGAKFFPVNVWPNMNDNLDQTKVSLRKATSESINHEVHVQIAYNYAYAGK